MLKRFLVSILVEEEKAEEGYHDLSNFPYPRAWNEYRKVECVCLSVNLAEGSTSLEPIDDGPKVLTYLPATQVSYVFSAIFQLIVRQLNWIIP